MTEKQSELIKSFKSQCPEISIQTEESYIQTYSTDWAKDFKGKAQAILFPKNTKEAQKIVFWAQEKSVALVPSGGRTGLSAGATATRGECIISFEKMNKVLSFNKAFQTIHCQAGVITETIKTLAMENGWLYPVDFSATGSSHIGGNVATNAGGINVVRYGCTRNWITGLTVITGRGEILELNHGLIKNATGLSLMHLFIGSEGILGLITEVKLKLTRRPENTFLFFVGFQKISSIDSIFQEFNKKFTLNAFELFTKESLKFTLQNSTTTYPWDKKYSYYLIIEIEQHNTETEAKCLESFELLLSQEDIQDGLMSNTPSQKKSLWALRENITESLSPFSPHKNDISIPLEQLLHFMKSLEDMMTSQELEFVYFGHIGDGNIHLNILKPPSMEQDIFLQKCTILDKKVFSLVKMHKGSVSAEHGIGLIKKPYLNYTRSEDEIKIMRDIKKVFDPDGIFNPGKIFDSFDNF